ncbi:MAG: DUF58 domain-containing protein [Nakamurella sp.]
MTEPAPREQQPPGAGELQQPPGAVEVLEPPTNRSVTALDRLTATWRAITNRGRAVALTTVIALVLGLATGWREWVGIAAALAVVLLAAILMALGRSSCTIDLELPQTRFNVAEPGWVTLLVRNISSRRMLPLQMELEILAGVGQSAEPAPGNPRQPAGATPEVGSLPADTANQGTGRTANTTLMSIPSIPGGGVHTVHIPLPTEHRAVVSLGPLRAVRGDVFGLIRRVVQWPVRREVFVRPRIARPMASLPGFVRDLEGEESSIRTASDLSFHTLREYVPGDDRRFIHWKSSARNGTLQVREFLQTHRSLVAVIMSGNPDEYHWGGASRQHRSAIDRRRDARPGDDRRGDDQPGADQRGDDRSDSGRNGGPADDAEFELAVSCAASMVADLVGRRRAVVTDAAGTPISGVTVDGVLDRFCAVQAQADAPDLAFATRAVLRRNPRASVVILVFGSLTDPARIRAAIRECPPGASVLALRARIESSPASLRLSGSDAGSVLTVPDVEALPGALRIAG